MTNKTKQVMISDYFPGMGLPGRDGEDGSDADQAMGALNTPTQRVGFGASMSANQGGLGSGVWAPINFDTAALNTGGGYNTGGLRWAPPPGFVLLTAYVLVLGN